MDAGATSIFGREGAPQPVVAIALGSVGWRAVETNKGS
jgi:hypothetical protein